MNTENQNQPSQTGTSSATSSANSNSQSPDTTQTTPTSGEATTTAAQSSSPIADAISGSGADSPPADSSQTDAPPPADAPPADATATDAPPAMEPYELVLADESPLSDEDFDKIVKMAEENGWTKEQAESNIKQYEEFYKNGINAANAPRLQYYQAQKDFFDKDPDFQGDNKPQTFMRIKKAAETFGGADLIAELNKPEVGNNYQLAKFLAKIGAQLEGDSPSSFGKPAGQDASKNEEDPLRRMYPSFFK